MQLSQMLTDRRLQAYQSRDGEVSGMHLLSQPVYFPPGVDEDDCLCDRQGFIQVAQCVQFPLLQTKLNRTF